MPPGQRRRVGQAGPRLEDLPLLRGVERDVVGRLRPGAHDRHLPPKDVHQLREFVQAVAA